MNSEKSHIDIDSDKITFEELPKELVIMLSKFVGSTETAFDLDGVKMLLASFSISNYGGRLTFVIAADQGK